MFFNQGLLFIVLAFALFPFSSVKGLKDNHEPYNLNTQAALDPANLQFQVVATGFDQPLLVTHAGDGSNRLFVVEKAGIIRSWWTGSPSR